MKKRIMSILLAALMLASSVDVTAFAADVSAAETEALGGVNYAAAETQEEPDAASGTENLTGEEGQEVKEEEPEAAPEEEPAETQTPETPASEPETETQTPETLETETQTEETEESSGSVEEEEAAEDAAGEAESEEEEAEETLRTYDDTTSDYIASDVVDTSYGNITWSIDADGKLTVKGTGDFADPANSAYNRSPWYAYWRSIKSAEITVTGMTNASYMFYACSNMTSLDLSGFDTSSVTDMSYMFGSCSVTDLDLSKLKTNNVTNMEGMFYSYNLTSLNLSGFDTSNVTNMEKMFCWSNLTSLDLSELDTSNVTSMKGMFSDCQHLTSLNLSGLDTSNVTNMESMFIRCLSLTSLELSGLDTSNVMDMTGMFGSCEELTSLNISNFNTSNVTEMSSMFSCCYSLTSVDVSGFNTSKVTDMTNMFYSCGGMISLDVSKFDTSNVTYMGYMFGGCYRLTSLDVSSFNTSNVTYMDGMFSGCSGLTGLDLSNFDTSNVTDMYGMFNDCSSLTSLDVGKFNTSNVTDMGCMFDYCSGLTSLNLNNFNTSNVTDMRYMFSGCSGLTSLDLSNFDTSNVTGRYSMYGMFSGCSSLTSLDLSNFNTSNVTDMESMFSGCTSLTSLDLSSFDMGAVTSADNFMDGCSALTMIYTPLNLSLSVALPNENGTDVWYDSEEHTYTELPQSLSESILLGKNGIPGIPHITAAMEKTEYEYGDTVSTNDITVTYYDKEGTSKTISAGDYETDISSIDITSLGSKTIIITYTPEGGTALTTEVEIFVVLTLTEGNTKVALPTESYIYDGNAKEPVPESVTVTYGDSTSGTSAVLSVGTDYELSYSNNTNVGTATLTLTGTGNYRGTLIQNFTIGKAEAPTVETLTVYADCSTAQENMTKDLSGCFKGYGVTDYVLASWTGSEGSTDTDTGTAAVLAGTPTVEGSTLSFSTNAGADGDTAIITLTVSFANYEDSSLTVTVILTGSSLFIEDISPLTYTGKALKPAIMVYGMDGKKLLSAGTDYTVQYYNNVDADRTDVEKNAAGCDKRFPYAVVVGKGDYAGEVFYKNFVIRPASLEDAVLKTEEQLATGTKAQKAIKSLKYNNMALTEGTDYEASLKLSGTGQDAGSVPAGGTYTLTITGKGNYQGTLTRTVYVADSAHLMKNATITIGKGIQKMDYTGSAITLTPAIKNGKDVFTVKIGKNYLTEGTDYTVSYDNNKAVGTATLTVTGIGDYLGTQSAAFQIKGTTFSAKTMKVAGVSAQTYTGEEITLNNVVTVTPKAGVDALKRDKDYTISYKNNIKAGTATMTFEGIPSSGYTGKFTQTFKIKAKQLDDKANGLQVELRYDTTAAYAPSGAKPAITLTYNGETLKEKTDYTVSYDNNKKAGNTATFTVTGKGNYGGSVKNISFTVTACDLSANDIPDPFTVTVAAATYSGSGQKPAVTVKYQKTKLKQGTDYTISYNNNTNVNEGAEVTIEGTGNYTGKRTVKFTVSPLSIANAKVKVTASISDKTYSGEAQEMSESESGKLTLTYNSIKLKEGTDYKVGYINNTAAGKASLVIAGKGNFTGMTAKTFKIAPLDISSDEAATEVAMTVDGEELGEGGTPYTAQPIKPAVTVSSGNVRLEEGRDYTVSYKNNTNAADASAKKPPTVTIKGMGNYKGSIEKKFTIGAAEKTSLAGASVTLKPDSYEYTGSPITPEPSVTLKANGETLTQGTDYTLSYSSNIEKGKASVTVTGIGKYVGTLTKTFQITAKPIGDKTVKVEIPSGLTYNGTAQKPEITVKDGEKTLTKGTDYKVSYSGNKNATTTAKVTITGMGNYSGSRTENFTIGKLDLSGENVTVKVEDLAYSATKSGKPKVTVTVSQGDAAYTVPSGAYSVTYGKYKGEPAGKKEENTIKVTSKGQNTEGENSTNSFYIGTSLKSAKVYLQTASCVYDAGAEGGMSLDGYQISVTLGGKIVPTDCYEISYENNTSAGKGRVVISGIGEKHYIGSVSKTFTIQARPLSEDDGITIEVPTEVTYTGGKLTPEVVVKDGGKTLKAGTDYTVKYSNNVKIGTATVTITGKKNYKGSIKKTFSITLPAGIET